MRDAINNSVEAAPLPPMVQLASEAVKLRAICEQEERSIRFSGTKYKALLVDRDQTPVCTQEEIRFLLEFVCGFMDVVALKKSLQDKPGQHHSNAFHLIEKGAAKIRRVLGFQPGPPLPKSSSSSSVPTSGSRL